MENIEKRLLTELEASHYLSISTHTLRKQRSDGDREHHVPVVPFIKLGRAIRYSVEDLDAYIEKHREGGLME